MQILYSSLHNLDLAKDSPIRKKIPSDFTTFMDAYVEFATTENKNSREYVPIDPCHWCQALLNSYKRIIKYL